MTTYNFSIESLSPLQVNPGDEVECKAALFKLEKGDQIDQKTLQCWLHTYSPRRM